MVVLTASKSSFDKGAEGSRLDEAGRSCEEQGTIGMRDTDFDLPCFILHYQCEVPINCINVSIFPVAKSTQNRGSRHSRMGNLVLLLACQ